MCGHIHHAEIRTVKGGLYANTGDWVESCTALVEHFDGRLQLVSWTTAGDHTAEPEPAVVGHTWRPLAVMIST